MYMPTYMSCMAEYGPVLVVCGKNRLVGPYSSFDFSLNIQYIWAPSLCTS